MYEFNSKETREKFKNTELGKKYNNYLLISGIVSVCAFILMLIGEITIGGKELAEVSQAQCTFVVGTLFLFVLSGMLTCYFDGKRDGAITEFALREKPKAKAKTPAKKKK